MIENLRRVTCDRCGAQTIVKSGTQDLFLSDYTRGEAGIADWTAVGDRHLCPACSSEFAKLRSRQLQETEAFFSS